MERTALVGEPSCHRLASSHTVGIAVESGNGGAADGEQMGLRGDTAAKVQQSRLSAANVEYPIDFTHERREVVEEVIPPGLKTIVIVVHYFASRSGDLVVTHGIQQSRHDRFGGCQIE